MKKPIVASSISIRNLKVTRENIQDFFLNPTFYFKLIIDSHAVVKKKKRINTNLCTPLPSFPLLVTLYKTIHNYPNYEIDIETIH